MEEPVLSRESADSSSLLTYELLILHTAEAEEWAAYLQHTLKSSKKFSKRSILLYTVGPADRLHGYNFESFHSCRCIVLLLTGLFMDILDDPELQGVLKGLLHPAHRVVALLCGVSEDDVLMHSFEDWPNWRKLYADDEPAVYISTILEAIANSRQVEAEHERKLLPADGFRVTDAFSTEHPPTAETEVVSQTQNETVLEDDRWPSLGERELSSPTQLTCLTVQPQRVLCGERETLFVIFTHKVDDQSVPEVEFTSNDGTQKRVQATVENEYTISVPAPDMPAGDVWLTLHTDQSDVRLKAVKYYTNLGEVGRCLENAFDPIDFMCQAFNLTSNTTELLDDMLTDSLKNKMPATTFQLFGIRQIEENNMAACQRNEELPTLLHFAAKYGLKKLTSLLLQIPGAIQAYSVMNKHGEYPNTLAGNNGFSDLKQFMDEFVKSQLEDSVSNEEVAEVYETMTGEGITGQEDVYEPMLVINNDCTEDIYEVMNAVDDNPDEALLREFFQANPRKSLVQDSKEQWAPDSNEQWAPDSKEQWAPEEKDQNELDQGGEEEEDPYHLFAEDIYDTIDADNSVSPEILYRPPAPIPRPEHNQEVQKPVAYISRVFSDKGISQSQAMDGGCSAESDDDPSAPVYDPYYAGMKTPGQRQLISLQDRVKVGEISVDEAVQEFKAWKIDHERRARSIRYQQENLKRLRDDIIGSRKDKDKAGKEFDLEISAPLPRRNWASSVTLECSVYEPTPRTVAPPPLMAPSIKRGDWKTGSTSSTSSTESNRLSTHSTVSFSSGTEPDLEDTLDLPPPPPRPLRTSEAVPHIPPPRIPPRIPERIPEKMLHERYIPCPTRALPQRPPPLQRYSDSAPPVPRRLR